jgi:hypothetical protein
MRKETREYSDLPIGIKTHEDNAGNEQYVSYSLNKRADNKTPK